MLVLATQRPDAKTLPEALRGQVGIRFAMKVMNWQSSDTILGAGAYPELDASKFLRSHKGVGILLGADDNELAEAGGQVVRTSRMHLPTLQRIVDRARELRIKAGTLTGVAAGDRIHIVVALNGSDAANSERRYPYTGGSRNARRMGAFAGSRGSTATACASCHETSWRSCGCTEPDHSVTRKKRSLTAACA